MHCGVYLDMLILVYYMFCLIKNKLQDISYIGLLCKVFF